MRAARFTALPKVVVATLDRAGMKPATYLKVMPWVVWVSERPLQLSAPTTASGIVERCVGPSLPFLH
jgi:hypothetical protein